MIDKNSFKVEKVSSYKNEVFSNLQQIYELEFMSVTGYRPDENGKFDQEFLVSTWSKNGYDIYLLYVDKSPIGFAVINLSSMIDGDIETRDVAEFFVLDQYRNAGLGTKFAQYIFKLYPGKWEVRQLPSLEQARRFWNKAIKSMKINSFQEEFNIHSWKGYLQKFTI